MSNEERYKKMEDKIRQAAQNQNPGFNPAAWDKLEQKLNKKEKKRRFIFWWLPALLCVSLTGLYLLNSSGISHKNTSKQVAPKESKQEQKNGKEKTENERSTSSTDNQPTTASTQEPTQSFEKKGTNVAKQLDQPATNQGPSAAMFTPKSSETIASSKIVKKQSNSNNSTPEVVDFDRNSVMTTQNQKSLTLQKKQAQKKSIVAKNNRSSKGQKEGNEELQDTDPIKISGKKNIVIQDGELGEMAETKETNGINKVKETNESNEVNNSNNKITKKQEAAIVPQPKLALNEGKKQDSAKLAKNVPVSPKMSKPIKTKKQQQSGFYVKTGFGFENAATKLFGFSNSTATPRVMGHLGYQINNRWSLDVGFISSSKKYQATGADYTIKPGTYLSTVKIKDIDAKCDVYEIPLNLQYNLVNRANNSFFFSTGISSYIMKSEDYIYSYTTQYGPPGTRALSFSKNTHLLATANFGIGWQHRIFKNTSFWLNPNISVPLGGVGEGKIKLYTSGINFGIRHLFSKK